MGPANSRCHALARLHLALLAAAVFASACGGGGGEPEPPPPEEPPLELTKTVRQRGFHRYDNLTRERSEIASLFEYFADGRRFDEEAELGPLPFNAPLGDATARLEAYSNETGMTDWVGAQAPSGRAPATPGIVGGEVQFQQAQIWVKKAENAKLEYVITHVQLDLIDSNAPGSLTFHECPWGEDYNSLQSCRQTLNAFLTFYFLRASADRTPGAFDPTELLIAKDGVAELSGWRAHWEPYTDEGWDGAWTEKDFVYDHDLAGGGELAHPRVKLRQPIVLKVPLAHLPVGTEIQVFSELNVHAFNHRQHESYAGAWLRDPGSTAGLAVVAEGVEPAPLREPLAPPPEPVDDTPECRGAPRPEAGTVAFAAAAFVNPERPGLGARITLVRTGGSTGRVSVGFATRDDSAKADSDYQAVQRRVRFRDGATLKSAHVPMVLDGVAEATETVRLELSEPRGCAELGPLAAATLRILDDDRAAPPPPSWRVGSTVTGLVGSGLVLEDRAQAIALPVAADGSFGFDRNYSGGQSYDVRVKLQPRAPLRICSGANGKGTVTDAHVTNVAVTCATPPPPAGLDTTFGSNGRATGGLLGSVTTIGLQSDGRGVGAGGARLARWSATGVPDAGFAGGAGEVPSVFGGINHKLDELVVQADDRLAVLVAYKNVGQFEYAVLRLDADGSLDNGFGTGGLLLVDFFGASDSANDLLVQPDGKLVAAGLARSGLSGSAALVRIHP